MATEFLRAVMAFGCVLFIRGEMHTMGKLEDWVMASTKKQIKNIPVALLGAGQLPSLYIDHTAYTTSVARTSPSTS